MKTVEIGRTTIRFGKVWPHQNFKTVVHFTTISIIAAKYQHLWKRLTLDHLVSFSSLPYLEVFLHRKIYGFSWETIQGYQVTDVLLLLGEFLVLLLQSMP